MIRHPLIIAPIGAQRQALLTERLHLKQNYEMLAERARGLLSGEVSRPDEHETRRCGTHSRPIFWIMVGAPNVSGKVMIRSYRSFRMLYLSVRPPR